MRNELPSVASTRYECGKTLWSCKWSNGSHGGRWRWTHASEQQKVLFNILLFKYIYSDIISHSSYFKKCSKTYLFNVKLYENLVICSYLFRKPINSKIMKVYYCMVNFYYVFSFTTNITVSQSNSVSSAKWYHKCCGWH